jgi:uncharacterized protein YlxW (UPF0749 family)
MLEIATAEDFYVLQNQLKHLTVRINSLHRKVTEMADATQADIDALTGQVQQVATDLDDARTKLQAEIDALANDGVDITALQEAIAPLDTAVQALGNIGPTPPAA